MTSGGSFSWVLVGLSAAALVAGVAAWAKRRGAVRLFLALTALLLTAVFLIPTLLYAPFAGEERLFDPETRAQLERVTRTVYDVVPVLLTLTLASFLTALVLLLRKEK